MARKPRVTVSKSSIGVFEDCERKWLLHYQFRNLPMAMRRDLAFQYRLMGSNALVGQIVDDVITYSIRFYENRGSWPQRRTEGARKLLDQYLDETDRWKRLYEDSQGPPEAGRRQPIDSYFFGELPSEDEQEAIIAQVVALAETWFASPVPQELVDLGVEHWRTPPKGDVLPPSFEHEGVTVWAKYDFAIQTPTETRIYDWKTGRVNPQTEEDLRDQLHTYAALALSQWETPPDHLRLYGVWLATGSEECVFEYPFDPNRLQTLRNRWKNQHQLLVDRLLSSAGKHDALFESFPMTSNRNRCLYCRFRSCDGYREAAKLHET